MHVVVAGAGGIGGAIAGELALGGGEVSIIDPWPDHVEAIRSSGLRLTGPDMTEECIAQVPAFHIGEWWRLAPIDLLIVAAKSFDNPWLAPLLAPRLTDDATVVSAQNGVNEPLLGELLGPERVIGAVVLFPAALTGPGQVRLDWHPTLQIGELDGTRTDRLDRVAACLEQGISAPVSDNIWGAIWSKLVMNCMSNPIKRRPRRQSPRLPRTVQPSPSQPRLWIRSRRHRPSPRPPHRPHQRHRSPPHPHPRQRRPRIQRPRRRLGGHRHRPRRSKGLHAHRHRARPQN